jgi:hypothetical protein
MSAWEAWGEPYNPSIPRGPDYDCQACGWDFMSFDVRSEQQKEAIVGFSPNMPVYSNKPFAVGIFIVECPRCFEKFWFHTDGNFYNALFRED